MLILHLSDAGARGAPIHVRFLTKCVFGAIGWQRSVSRDLANTVAIGLDNIYDGSETADYGTL